MRRILWVWVGLCLTAASCGPRPDQPLPALPTAAAAQATATPVAATPTPISPTPTSDRISIPWAPWPTLDWASASPEQVGMDSNRLLTLVDLLSEQKLNLHSLLIIRRGYLVLELLSYPYQASTPQDLQSCTKSVTALLTGIALQAGQIKSVDQKVLDFFPDRSVSNLDANKRAITVRHLLSMTAGLNWPEAGISYSSRDNPVRAMWGSADPVQYVLDRPMAGEPGKTFTYNTGASQLLAAILEDATGQKLSAFARQHLFEPLGIQNYVWHTMRGVEAGGAGLFLTPRNMAKLGYLYLRKGRWDSRQVVPAAWVAESTRKQVETDMHSAYGYQWWVTPDGESYSAAGFGGQLIAVYPQKDLVVVATGAMNQAQRNSLRNQLDFFVLPAVLANHSLPASATADQLRARVQAASARPAARPLSPLPATAQQIGGRSYTLESNPLYWQQFQLEFAGAEAYLTVRTNNGESKRLTVGVDGVPRLNATFNTVLHGKWEDDFTFSLHYEPLGDADGRTIRFEFSGKEVQVTSTSFVQQDVAIFKGKTP